MEVEQLLRMNGGKGKTSYSNNSVIQKQAMSKANPILEETITLLYCTKSLSCLKVADLGCSSGPNTLSLVWKIIDLIDISSQRLDRKPPMFQFFLNDLHGNDFNTIFRSLTSFHEKIKREKGCDFGPFLIAGVPGSFYGRLFPDHSLHFIHSSFSLHWLSQVPEELRFESGFPLNKGNIYIAKTSPREVHKAYLNLFKNDFMLFLKCRSQEIITGGCMVLTIVATEKTSKCSGDHKCTVWELLGITLNDMVLEGLIEEAKLDQFNLPYYAPTEEEMRQIVLKEGSFKIQQLETFKVDWDANISYGNKTHFPDNQTRANNIAMSIRAVAEPILASSFGKEIMDGLFQRYAKTIVHYLEKAKGECTSLVISLTKA